MQDQELAVSLILLERSRCPGCGHPKSEVWVEDADTEFDYIAEEVQCQACHRLESARAGNKTEKGLHYYLERMPRGEHRHEPEINEPEINER